jgi:hypothetical protein
MQQQTSSACVTADVSVTAAALQNRSAQDGCVTNHFLVHMSVTYELLISSLLICSLAQLHPVTHTQHCDVTQDTKVTCYNRICNDIAGASLTPPSC